MRGSIKSAIRNMTYTYGKLFTKLLCLRKLENIFFKYGFTRDCPLVVSDLRSETKGSSPDASNVQRWALCSNRPADV